ncbi:uncharacterized protein N0V89_004433 [Didymosphaeria variabile]|uniref:Myb-like domain-containing protein n=1 Tax=Didymosphaeria variabile TaxID=1932322 RepID=A0A9W8XPF4_9PLEO|nr:uncharacterized protein N0V89_004433 [Didymosphaeria variabile]KAJ4356400.1 hypothetical protein N0V89_004433 [Didymosphaeria variabile]
MKVGTSATHGGTPWRVEEDTQIEDGVRIGLEFHQICALFPSRSSEAVRHRISRARRNIQAGNPVVPKTAIQNLKGGRPWTTEEDETLDKAIINSADLSQIRTLFPGRSADSVRHRYNRNLKELNSQDADLLREDAQTTGSPLIAEQKADGSSKAAALWSPEDDQKVEDAVSANFDDHVVLSHEAMFQSPLAHSMQNNTPSRPKQDHEKELKSVSFADELQVRRISRTPGSIPLVKSFQAQAFQGSVRPSTPPRPVVEPLTPPFRAQELPAIDGQEYAFGMAPYQPYPEESHILQEDSSNEAQIVDMFLPNTRAFLRGVPENQSPGDASQERNHPFLPHGSIDNIPLTALANPSEPFMSFPTDNGYGQYTSSVDNHPDLRNGFDWAPTSHRLVTPPTLVTSEQLFTDPSTPPSYFMDMDDTPFISDDQLMDAFWDFQPELDEDMLDEQVPVTRSDLSFGP